MIQKDACTPKGLTFQACDEALVEGIIQYQQEKGLPTFIAAVRQLCSYGLEYTTQAKTHDKQED